MRDGLSSSLNSSLVILSQEEFLERLSLAHSNLPEYGNGRDIYAKYVKPAVVDLEKVGAHYSITSLFAPYGERTDLFSYAVKRLNYHTGEAGKLRMALGQAQVHLQSDPGVGNAYVLGRPFRGSQCGGRRAEIR